MKPFSLILAALIGVSTVATADEEVLDPNIDWSASEEANWGRPIDPTPISQSEREPGANVPFGGGVSREFTPEEREKSRARRDEQAKLRQEALEKMRREERAAKDPYLPPAFDEPPVSHVDRSDDQPSPPLPYPE